MRALPAAIRQNSLRDCVASFKQAVGNQSFDWKRASLPLRGGTHAGAAYGHERTIVTSSKIARKRTYKNTSYRMIDWKVIVNGQLPSDWSGDRGCCWFPDFDTQKFLLPHFNVGDQPIDEYGKTVFDAAAVSRLGRHLSEYRGHVEARPSSWSITEHSTSGDVSYVIDRETVLVIIDKTLSMVEYALSEGGELIFYGD